MFTNITTNKAFIAVYEEIPQNISIKWKDYDGSVIRTDAIQKGGTATPPSDPVRSGYNFMGWDVGPYYRVTFKDYNGAVIQDEYVKSGANAIPPTTPTRSGYTFSGWDSALYNSVAKDVVITAQYKEKTKYTVRWYNNTVLLRTDSIAEGESVTPPSFDNTTMFSVEFGKDYYWLDEDVQNFGSITKNQDFYVSKTLSKALHVRHVRKFNYDGACNYPTQTVYAAIRPRADIFTDYSWVEVIKNGSAVDTSELEIEIGDGTLATATADTYGDIRILAKKVGKTTLTIKYKGETRTVNLIVTQSYLKLGIEPKGLSDSLNQKECLVPFSGDLKAEMYVEYILKAVCVDYDENNNPIDARIPITCYDSFDGGKLTKMYYDGVRSSEYVFYDDQTQSVYGVADSNFFVGDKVYINDIDNMRYVNVNSNMAKEATSELAITLNYSSYGQINRLVFVEPDGGGRAKVSATFDGQKIETYITYGYNIDTVNPGGLKQSKLPVITFKKGSNVNMPVPISLHHYSAYLNKTSTHSDTGIFNYYRYINSTLNGSEKLYIKNKSLKEIGEVLMCPYIGSSTIVDTSSGSSQEQCVFGLTSDAVVGTYYQRSQIYYSTDGSSSKGTIPICIKIIITE